jgi:hypothetical protein
MNKNREKGPSSNRFHAFRVWLAATACKVATEAGYEFVCWKAVTNVRQCDFFAVALKPDGEEIVMPFPANKAELAPAWAEWIAADEGKAPRAASQGKLIGRGHYSQIAGMGAPGQPAASTLKR